MLLFNLYFISSPLSKSHFNTSNVTIQQFTFLLKCVIPIHFNTSNVTIQQLLILLLVLLEHISIHLMLLFNIIIIIQLIRYIRISIHLMLLFNLVIVGRYFFLNNFNTSNVTIQPKSKAYYIEGGI